VTTVRDIIADAYTEIGYLALGDPLPAEEAAFGLRTLNRLFQKWNTEELMIYTLNRQIFNFVAGKQSYTLGIGGDFNTPRPVQIQMASVLNNSNPVLPVEIPIKILTDWEWRSISVKAVTTTFPTSVWIQGNMPLNTLDFWPVPQDATYQAVLYTWGKTENFADINQTIQFPNGYEEFILTALAIALSGSSGITISPALSNRAATAKNAIESLNIEPLFMTTDLGGNGSSIAIRSFGMVVDNG